MKSAFHRVWVLYTRRVEPLVVTVAQLVSLLVLGWFLSMLITAWWTVP